MTRTACFLALLLLPGCASPAEDGEVRIADIHGLALDPNVPTRLYVATHHGLFVAENDTNWAAVTREPFDMMGFTMHPRDGRIMYASGHPSKLGDGWAVGVMKSTDAGQTWVGLSLKNQVDFHAMAMEGGSDGAADILYGFHGGKVHVSVDGGTTWTSESVPFDVTSLAVEPGSGDLLLATQTGLRRIGRQLAGDWTLVSPNAAVGVAAGPHSLVAYFANSGLSRSLDGGATWADLNWTAPAGDYPWGIALGAPGSGVLYAGTVRGQVYKTSDHGASWNQVR